MNAAPEPSSARPGTAGLVVSGLVAAALVLAAFAGDGSGFGGVLSVGGVAAGLLAALLVVFALGRLTLPRIGWPGGALLVVTVLLAAWTGATMAWSIAPDRSWDTFNRTAVFAVFLGLGVVLAGAGGRFGARLGAAALALTAGIVLTYALVAKAVPALDPEGDRIARLREPVDYWNALAIIADLAIPLALWVGATRGRAVRVRILGGLLAYVATLALLLTLSRSGLVAAIGVVVLWFLLSRERLAGGLLLAASAGPAALVAAWAFTRPALVDDGAERADRVADGAAFGVLALVGAVLVAVLVGVGARRALAPESRRRVGAGLLAVGAVGLAAGVVAVAVAIGNPVTWFDDEVTGASCSEVVNDPSRLGSLNVNNRWCWWNEAWDVFAAHAPEGAGAGTFEIARKRFRTDIRNVLEPHSVPLQELADGGALAFALFIALVVAGLAVAVGAVRRLGGDERAAAVALVAAPAAYLAHALVDYSWDFLAATAPVLVALGVLAGAGQPQLAVRTRPIVVVAAVVALAMLVGSFASPRLSDRYVRSSTRALEDGDLEGARDRALWARFFDPLSVEPIYALARVAETQRVPWRAERHYIHAVELQPSNPETWYTLGIFEFQVRGNLCAAYRFLNNAYTLDPAGLWLPGGPLDVARKAVNAGGCAPGS
jgi:O-antigen ligase